MNCAHCRQLIESGPLPELDPDRIEAIEQHAQSCPDCRHVLQEARRIELALVDLPEPVLPDGLEASIMQRVFEREADQALTKARPPAQKRHPLGSIALGGVLAIGAELFALVSGRAPLPSADVFWQPAAQSLASMPHGNLGMLVLVIGLLLMLSGLAPATDTDPIRDHGK